MAAPGIHDSLVVSLRAISGETVWGPTAVASTTRVTTLRQLAAEALGQSPASVRLLHDGSLLQPSDSLAGAGVPDGAELGLVLLSLQAEVRQTFRKLRESAWVSIREDPDRVPEAAVPAALAGVAEACGCERLPEDVAVWLDALLRSGRALRDNAEQKYDLDDGLQSLQWHDSRDRCSAQARASVSCGRLLRRDVHGLLALGLCARGPVGQAGPITWRRCGGVARLRVVC